MRFAAHLRNPAAHPPPEDVEDRRMAIYRGLFFRNIAGFVAKNFPVLRTLYDDAAWRALVRDFYEHHHARTPLFPEIPREFLQFLEARLEQAGLHRISDTRGPDADRHYHGQAELVL